MRGIIEGWAGLPWWMRFGAAFAFLGFAAWIYFSSGRIWISGWAIGAILFLFSFPSGPERKGYRF